MARLLFGGDDVSMRGPYGSAQLNASGRTGIVYADATTSALADIVTYPGGAAIAGSVITVTADSQLPLFQGPADGSDTVWVSVDGGTRTPIYTNVDARLDLLNTTVAGKVDTAGVGLTKTGTTLAADFGSGAGKVTQGNDSRLSDARTPVAHAHTETDVTSLTTDLGTRLNWRGAWAATTAYVTNDLVTFNGGLYRAPSNFTSGGTFNIANWVELVAQSGTYGSPYHSPSGGDDSATLAAAGQDLLLARGTFNIAAGLSLAAATRLQGRGRGDIQTGVAHTELASSSATVDALTVTAAGSDVRDLAVYNTSGTTPTAGSGVKASVTEGRFDLDRVDVRGFYTGLSLAGRLFTADKIAVANPVQYGVVVGNAVGDHGQGYLTNAALYSGPDRAGNTALLWQAGGGFRTEHLKIGQFAGGGTMPWVNGIRCVIITSTGELEFGNIVIDEFTGDAFFIDSTGAGNSISGLSLSDFSIQNSKNYTRAIYVRSTGGQRHQQVRISDGIIQGASTMTSCIDVDYVMHLDIEGVSFAAVPITVPLIALGGEVYNARVRLGFIAPAVNTAVYAAGALVRLLTIANPNRPGNGGSGSFEFTGRSQPLVKGTYKNLWKIDLGWSGAADIELFGQWGGARYDGISRRRVVAGATSSTVDMGTEEVRDNRANEVDIQWTASGTAVIIAAQINAASADASKTGISTIRVNGVPTEIDMYGSG